jgi:hypothetical protein
VIDIPDPIYIPPPPPEVVRPEIPPPIDEPLPREEPEAPLPDRLRRSSAGLSPPPPSSRLLRVRSVAIIGR